MDWFSDICVRNRKPDFRFLIILRLNQRLLTSEWIKLRKNLRIPENTVFGSTMIVYGIFFLSNSKYRVFCEGTNCCMKGFVSVCPFQALCTFREQTPECSKMFVPEQTHDIRLLIDANWCKMWTSSLYMQNTDKLFVRISKIRTNSLSIFCLHGQTLFSCFWK